MVERIIPPTEALAERERKIIEALAALFPDGNVSGLDAVDKSLGRRLSDLYPLLGYESRSDMIQALGFRQEPRNLGGRPPLDYEAIFEELASRYEGRPKPTSLGQLKFENPDLQGKLKSLSNKCTELYGRSIAKELAARGLLESGSAAQKLADDGEIQAMLDRLVEKYQGATTKPSTIIELKAENPEYEDTIVAFEKLCNKIYRRSPRAKLIELGICATKKKTSISVTAEEVEEAIDDLGELLMQIPEPEKPDRIATLKLAYPELGAIIEAGKKAKLTDKEPLQRLGILAAPRSLLKKIGIRTTPVEMLAEDYESTGHDVLVMADGPDAALLPPGILGIDLEAKVELREIVKYVQGSGANKLKVGDELPINYEQITYYDGSPHTVVHLGTWPSFNLSGRYDNPLFDDVVVSSDSSLAHLAGGSVIAVSQVESVPVAQIKVRYLGALRNTTLAYMLRELGIVTEKDVRGSLEWRFRLRMLQKGTLSIASPCEDKAGSTQAAEVPREIEVPSAVQAQPEVEAPSVVQAQPEAVAPAAVQAQPEAAAQVAEVKRAPVQQAATNPAQVKGKGLAGLSTIQRAYFETIADLISEGQQIRSVDLADVMGVTTAAVAKMMPVLKDSGLIVTDIDGFIKLTLAGCFAAGVEPEEQEPASKYAFENDPTLGSAHKRYLRAIAEMAENGKTAKSVDVANALDVSKASVTKAICILEERGYIRKEGRALLLTDLATGGVSPEIVNDFYAPAYSDYEDALDREGTVGQDESLASPAESDAMQYANQALASRSFAIGTSNKAEPADALQYADQAVASRSFAIGASDKADLVAKYEEKREAARKAEEERKRKEAEKAARKAEEERKRKEAKEAARRAEEERKRKEAEEAARKAEEAAAAAEKEKEEARAAFDKIAEKIANARKQLKKASKVGTTVAEREAADANANVKSLMDQIKNLGFFAFSEKKRLNAELEIAKNKLERLQAQVPLARAKAEKARDEAVAKIKAQIEQLENESEQYVDILAQDIIEKLKGKAVGDIVEFGSYPQESAKAAPTPIKWRVCKATRQSMVLLSADILDYRQLSSKSNPTKEYGLSDLREWLANEFFEEAFNLLEQRFIKIRPYILKKKELEEYYPNQYNRVAKATAYAKSKGGDRFYWVATSGPGDDSYVVNGQGHIMGDRTMIYFDGMDFMSIGVPYYEKCGVRPAICVRVK